MKPTASPAIHRADNEIAHGRFLSQGDPEALWGWGTDAGRLRAKRRAELILEAAGLGPGAQALELGCGTGNFTEAFAKSGARLLAVDISPDLLERAAQRNLPVDQVAFQAARFEDLDLPNRFDAVIGSSVLHHLELEPALEKILELLRPGGMLAFAEPNLLNPQVFLERKLQFLPLFSYVSPDETAFVRWRLAARLARIGFVDISLTPFDWLHPATPPALIPWIKRFEGLVERTPVAREFAGSLLIRARRPRSAILPAGTGASSAPLARGA